MINLGRPNVDGSEEDLFLWLIIIPNLIPPERELPRFIIEEPLQ